MKTHHLDKLVERMASSNIATAAELRGCTDKEISDLETLFSIRLPEVYREFLQLMGRNSGKLFTHDDIVASYPDIVELNNTVLANNNSDEAIPIPKGSLIILSRLEEQYEFIKCIGSIDVPVMYYNIDEEETAESHPSIAKWLDSWCTEAEEAISDGYYEQEPD